MHDVRIAFRELRRAPIVTAVAVLSLALGIGANTAIFSLVNALLVRSLPVSRPEQIAVVTDTRADGHGFVETWTYAVYQELARNAQAFDGIAASWADRVNLAVHGGEAEPIDALWASGNYFSMLGVSPLLGRAIAQQDDVSGGGSAGAVAVLGYDFWQRRYGGASTAVG